MNEDLSKFNKLFEAFAFINDPIDMKSFCRDIMTIKEIEELAGRLAVAGSLDEGNSQRKTSSLTGVSIATVTRVNQWLKRGLGGYKLALDNISKVHQHPN